MSDDRLEPLARLCEEGDALLRDARSAAEVTAAPGSDPTGSVRVTLDDQGRVAGVTVVTGWRQRLGTDELAGAVVEAVRDASMRRLEAWGEAYGSAPANGRPVTEHVEFDRDDFQRQLQAAATGQMSEADRRAALTELLELVESVERGIDEVSGSLRATLGATHSGQSPDRHVTVTLTGGGEVTAVRLDRAWLREAHEINVGRQVTAAFRTAYEKVAAQGVRRLIADSSLGAVQRATQDPFGLAQRLRLRD
jgi:DNA-binding protein YbaB